MRVSKLSIRKAAEISLFSILLLMSGIAYGDASQELQKGEQIVVLNVENMT